MGNGDISEGGKEEVGKERKRNIVSGRVEE